MASMKDLLDEALNETIAMHNAPIDDWNKETPGAPFGPSIAAGDEFGFYRTSNKAMNALAQIGDEFQANDKEIDRTVSQDTARLEAANTLGELLNKLRKSDDKIANWKAFRTRFRERLDSHKYNITHYFPVWLFLQGDVADFDIGPVSFRSSSSWLNEVERRRGTRSSWMDGVQQAWAGHLVNDTTVPVEVRSVARSVRSDQWVACVSVQGFERTESYRRALIAVRSALNTMRLIVPSPENAKIAAAVDHGPPLSIDRLSQIDGQDLAHGGSINLRGLSGAPGMASNLVAHSATLRKAAGRRIDVLLLTNPQNAPCQKLSERWINAVHWYGRGCAEEADFIALVNFVVALDILSGGLMEKGIIELAARLLQVPTSQKALADGTDLRQLIGRMYGYRSEIAHGSILALDERLRAERAQVESLTATMLATYVEKLDIYAASSGADDRDSFTSALPPIPVVP